MGKWSVALLAPTSGVPEQDERAEQRPRPTKVRTSAQSASAASLHVGQPRPRLAAQALGAAAGFFRTVVAVWIAIRTRSRGARSRPAIDTLGMCVAESDPIVAIGPFDAARSGAVDEPLGAAVVVVSTGGQAAVVTASVG